MIRRLKAKDWEALNERIKVTWRPDPHRRGRVIPSKKLYKRKPRTPSGASESRGRAPRFVASDPRAVAIL